MINMNIRDTEASVPNDGYDASPTIYLNSEQCEALGIDEAPPPGTVFMLRVRAVVKRVTAEMEDPAEGEGTAPDLDLTLCCTDMEISSGGPDNTATLLYGKS
jgi:hypothetical protein